MLKDFNKTAIIAGERNISYAEMLQRISLFARHTPKDAGAKTIVLSENREGWIYAFFSIWNNHGIAVPVDATSTVHDIAYIIKDCRPVCVWTSRKKVDLAREAIAEAGVEVQILLIDDYEQIECTEEKADIVYEPQDTALIIYTSGTTGSPKGVMLSYENINVNVRAVTEEVEIFNADRRTLILLPLHHVLPLVGTVIMPLVAGGGVAICATMSGPDIMDTLCRGEVAIMVGVPRLWQTIYAGVMKKINASFITRALFNMCARANNLTLSRTIFKAVHKKMGGHIRYFVSGGAALDREIALGLQTLGLEVLEGYGMTEAAPMISFTRPGDLIPKCVGLPLNDTEIKIIDGEICARGPQVMKGYYNRPEETAQVIDKDGFLHTGDLGQLDEKGHIFITGRSKEIIVLSNGKNVQPNEIEYKLEKYEDRVKEAAVVQDGDLLRAIIVPQATWAKDLSDEEVEEALKREVLEPYNLTVANYKKLMSLFVYRGDLPRTRMEKLQRFKLKDIIAAGSHEAKEKEPEIEPTFEEYQIIKHYIETEKKVKVRQTDHIETDLAFDSLDRVGLQGFIEQTFGMKMNADSMTSYKNVLAIAEQVADHKTRMEVEDEDWNKFLHKSSSELELPSASFSYSLISRTFRAFFKVYNRLTVKGVENIPAEGPFIIAPNHQSFLDGPLVSTGLSTRILNDSYSYATEEHFNSAFRKFVARNNNVILMERGNLRDSILKMAEVLKQGKNVIIFPEGSRTHTGGLGAFKKTFAILSKELNVPIIPVCIKGAFEALPRFKKVVTPHKIEVEYLPPIQPDANLSYEEIAEQVKKAIGEVLDK